MSTPISNGTSAVVAPVPVPDSAPGSISGQSILSLDGDVGLSLIGNVVQRLGTAG